MASDTTAIAGQPSLSTHSIGVVGYKAPRANMTIPQISDKIIAALADAGALSNYDSIIFVAHSLGGILVKDLIVHAKIRPRDFLSKIKAVFLIAVPSQGSGTANVAAQLPSACREGLSALITIEFNTYLQAIDRGWDEFMSSRDSTTAIRVFCTYETRPFPPLVTAVPQSATKTSCDEHSWAVDAHHFNIVRPANARADIHTWVRRNIALALSNIAAIDAAAASKEIARAQYLPQQDDEQLKQSMQDLMQRAAKSRMKCRTEAVFTDRGHAHFEMLVSEMVDRDHDRTQHILKARFTVDELREILAYHRAGQTMARVLRAATPNARKSLTLSRNLTADLERRHASAEKWWHLSRMEDMMKIELSEMQKMTEDFPGLKQQQRARMSKLIQSEALWEQAREAYIWLMVDYASLEEIDQSIRFLAQSIRDSHSS